MIAFLFSPIGKILGAAALVVGLWLGVLAWGDAKYNDGVSAERVVWERAAEAERVRQASVKTAVEEIGAKVVADLGDRIAAIEPRLKGLLDAAAKEDEKPVPEACRDVYRGLPPGILRGIEDIR